MLVEYRDFSGRGHPGKCSGWYLDHPALIHEGAAVDGVGPFLTQELALAWFETDQDVCELLSKATGAA